MTTKPRHIALMIGIGLVFISFLFFARKMAVYQICLISGFIISGISFLSILIKKDKVKSKLLWTGIVIILGFLQYLSEPILIDSSYKIYYFKNKGELNDLKNYLITIPGDLTVMSDKVRFDLADSLIDKNQLIKFHNDLNCTYIFKKDNYINVELWGRLDIRHGLIYSTDNKVIKNRKMIKDNWYH